MEIRLSAETLFPKPPVKPMGRIVSFATPDDVVIPAEPLKPSDAAGRYLSVDWPTVLRELRATGMSWRKISCTAHISEKIISHLANGSQKHPSFDSGIRLLMLHAERCAKNHAEMFA